MFYVIDNFYHISSSLYAYRSLSLPAAGTDRLLLPSREREPRIAGKNPLKTAKPNLNKKENL